MFMREEEGIARVYWCLSNPRHPTLNQRATGSIPVRPTNKINDLGRSRQDPLFHKTCYRSVSGNRAAAFYSIPSAGLEFFDHTGNPDSLYSFKNPCILVCMANS